MAVNGILNGKSPTPRSKYFFLHQIINQGTVKINAHYFEDGNVQLKVNKAYSTNLAFTDAEKDAQKAFDFIRSNENQLLAGLNEVYESLPTEVFKTMRKEIPCKKK